MPKPGPGRQGRLQKNHTNKNRQPCVSTEITYTDAWLSHRHVHKARQMQSFPELAFRLSTSQTGGQQKWKCKHIGLAGYNKSSQMSGLYKLRKVGVENKLLMSQDTSHEQKPGIQTDNRNAGTREMWM